MPNERMKDGVLTALYRRGWQSWGSFVPLGAGFVPTMDYGQENERISSLLDEFIVSR
jgi:hypothetical protein